MENDKTPKLPADVAKLYDCSIIPTVVILQNPRREIDLTRISLKQAEELAAEGKFLTRKAASEVKAAK
jgi:hypothetical protein